MLKGAINLFLILFIIACTLRMNLKLLSAISKINYTFL